MTPRFTLFTSRYEDDDFEWDESKSFATFAKRGFVFEAVRIVFRGRLLRRRDLRTGSGEERWQVLGSLYGKIVHIVYTPRGAKCRIILFRPATDQEALIYHDR